VYNTFCKTYYTRIIRIIQPTFQKFIKHISIIVMRPQQWIQLTFVHCIKQNVLYTYYTYYTAHISKIHKTQFNSCNFYKGCFWEKNGTKLSYFKGKEVKIAIFAIFLCCAFKKFLLLSLICSQIWLKSYYWQ